MMIVLAPERSFGVVHSVDIWMCDGQKNRLWRSAFTIVAAEIGDGFCCVACMNSAFEFDRAAFWDDDSGHDHREWTSRCDRRMSRKDRKVWRRWPCESQPQWIWWEEIYANYLSLIENTNMNLHSCKMQFSLVYQKSTYLMVLVVYLRRSHPHEFCPLGVCQIKVGAYVVLLLVSPLYSNGISCQYTENNIYTSIYARNEKNMNNFKRNFKSFTLSLLLAHRQHT